MLRNRLFSLLALLVVASMVLAACGGAQTEAPAVEETEAPATEETATEAPAEPTPVPTTRKGGWLDEVVVSVVSSDAAVTQIEAGAIDIYASGLSSNLLPEIEAAGLGYSEQNGLFYELTYNPVGNPTFEGTGKLNPFSSAKVREAMNWLVDREYINQEVYAGGALAKFFPITTQFPDYADLADIVRQYESKYAYNPEKANEVITAEMEAMGATKNADGKWEFNGEPVTIILIIRNDSDGTRVPIGDYVANQLESIGFATDRQYKTSSEASPIWISGNPADGLFHIYTGAWSASIIDRDQGDNFQFYDTPASAYSFSPLWQSYAVSEEYQNIADDLAFNRYTSLEERRARFEEALAKHFEYSFRTWLIDGKNFAPYREGVEVTYDLAAGVSGAQIAAYTLRFADQEGGTMKWGQPDLFVDPWNPIAGSNWAFDASVQRFTQSYGMMYDPHTGLTWPHRIESAEVTAVEGLPIGVTHDWVTLNFASEIPVPEDAWVDWDAANGTFITAAEKYPDGTTAQTKSVVTYPADLFETVKWHDGSNFSVADIVMGMIMTFDPGTEGSAIFDEAQAGTLESFKSVFKGYKIVSTEPLVIEYYSDGFSLDAEINVATLWPAYAYGEAPWHTIAIGNLADAAGELAYSADKADAAQIEWLSFIGGPSLEILKGKLDQAATESYIPYPNVLGQFITAEEAAARYANLSAWYDAHGHFWVGTGPYYLDQAFLTEKTATLKQFADYPDLADRWARFGAPKIADVEIDGAGQVTIGDEATFDIFVTFEGEAYPADEIKQVKYLLYDATGVVVSVGEAEAVGDGQYTVVLPADVTSTLAAGANKLEVAVVPLPVAVPTFQSFEFVTAP
ncbi:MAG: ABC transporter substrate-binding protein [Anaerolineales bacterium]